jgi:hypothetical protein
MNSYQRYAAGQAGTRQVPLNKDDFNSEDYDALEEYICNHMTTKYIETRKTMPNFEVNY